MHQCKDYHLQYLPIVLGIVSIISIFTGAGCFLGVALAVLGIVFGFIILKKLQKAQNCVIQELLYLL